MNRNIQHLLVITLSICRCLTLPDSVAETNIPPLSLNKCIETGLLYAKSSDLFEGTAMKATADLKGVRSMIYPHLNFSAGGRYYFDDSDIKEEISFNLGDHFLEVPHNSVRKSIAKIGLYCADLKIKSKINSYYAKIMHTYINCIRYEHQLRLATSALILAEKYESGWNNIKSDNANIQKKQKAAKQLHNSKQEAVKQLQMALRQTRYRLHSLTGLDENNLQHLEEPQDYKMTGITLNQCIEWALTHRSDLRELQYQINLSSNHIKLARMRYLPTPELSFGYGERDDDNINNNSEDTEFFARLSLTFSIWDAGETGSIIQQIQAKHKDLKDRKKFLEMEIRTSVTKSFMNLRKTSEEYQNQIADIAPKQQIIRARIMHKNHELSDLDLESAEQEFSRHALSTLENMLTCFDLEADLLELLEATREDIGKGLSQRNF